MKASDFITESVPDGADKLMSLLIFLRNRAEQLGAKTQISMKALSQMASGLGIPLTYDSFSAIHQSNPGIQNLVTDFNKDVVIFKNTDGEDDQTISTPDDADIKPTTNVDKMAKRALKKRS
jgi:hypothetical protein